MDSCEFTMESQEGKEKFLGLSAVVINISCQTSQNKFKFFSGFCLFHVEVQEQEKLLGPLCGYEERALYRLWLSSVYSFSSLT